MVANGVPVLLTSVRAQGLAAWVKRNGIQVREIATLRPIEEKAVEQVDRQLSILQDAWVASDPISLKRTCQRVNLLIGWNGVKVIAEFRGKDFCLTLSSDV